MYNYTANLVVLFPLAVSLFVAMRLGEGMIGGSRTGWVRSIAYIVIGLMITLSIAGVLIRIGVFGLIWLAGLSIVIVIIGIRSRALGRSAMYHSLATVDADRNYALMAQDFITHNAGSVRRRAKRFLRSLDQLGDWSAAMESSRIAQSPSEKLSCRAKKRYGDNLEQVSLPLVRASQVQQEAERLLARMYPIPVAVLGFVVLGLIMWRIIPKLAEILEEFNIELPMAISKVINISETIFSSHWWFFFAMALLALAAASAFNVIAWIFPLLAQRYPLRLLTKPYYRSLGLLSLSIAMKRQPEVRSACQSAASLMSVSFISDKLQQAGKLIELGQPPASALLGASMISRQQAALLQSAESAQNLPWAIEQIANTTVERTLRFYAISSQILVVALVLVLAAIYGYFASAIVEALAQIIFETAKIK